jgi:hypothetical protein
MPCSEWGHEDQRKEKFLRARHGHALESLSEPLSDKEMEISRHALLEGEGDEHGQKAEWCKQSGEDNPILRIGQSECERGRVDFEKG